MPPPGALVTSAWVKSSPRASWAGSVWTSLMASRESSAGVPGSARVPTRDWQAIWHLLKSSGVMSKCSVVAMVDGTSAAGLRAKIVMWPWRHPFGGSVPVNRIAGIRPKLGNLTPIYIYIYTRIFGPPFGRPRFFRLTFRPRFTKSRNCLRIQILENDSQFYSTPLCREFRCASCWHSHLIRLSTFRKKVQGGLKSMKNA